MTYMPSTGQTTSSRSAPVVSATGLVIGGKREAAPGLVCTNWLDDPALRLRRGSDFSARRTPLIRQIVLHTTCGLPASPVEPPQMVRAGRGPGGTVAERRSRWWTVEGRGEGAHLVVDFDGGVFSCCDVLLEAALHADNVNQTSVGIELVQGRDATLYEAQLDAAVRLIDFLTRRFGIQRQIPHSYAGAVERLAALAVDDVVGVLGHRDLSPRRGPGDPGSAIMNALATAGYEPVDYGRAHDLDLWKRRQAQLALDPIDGVPGPETVDRLRAAGHAHGLWISRPGDLGR